MVFVLIGISAHPVWIGLILSYFFGYKLGWTPITGYCDFFNPPDGSTAAARAVVLPPDPAVDHVRDPLRRALRADDPRERDGDAERGLRAHGARQGRAGARGHALARPAQRDAAGRDDARHGHRRSRSAARSSPRRSSASRASGSTAIESIYALRPPDRRRASSSSRRSLIIVFNLLVDLLYAWIDPRIRLA